MRFLHKDGGNVALIARTLRSFKAHFHHLFTFSFSFWFSYLLYFLPFLAETQTGSTQSRVTANSNDQSPSYTMYRSLGLLSTDLKIIIIKCLKGYFYSVHPLIIVVLKY